LPFKMLIPCNKIQFKLKYKLDYMVNRDNFYCEIMIDGRFAGVYSAHSGVDEFFIECELLDSFDFNVHNSINVGFFFRIFDHSAKSEDKRNISVLFENISLQVM